MFHNAVCKEILSIKEALLKIDTQVLDEDRGDFYVYVLNELYDMKLDFGNPDFTPKTYQKVLLAKIRDITGL